jgi:hypothetical protein
MQRQRNRGDSEIWREVLLLILYCSGKCRWEQAARESTQEARRSLSSVDTSGSELKQQGGRGGGRGNTRCMDAWRHLKECRCVSAHSLQVPPRIH